MITHKASTVLNPAHNLPPTAYTHIIVYRKSCSILWICELHRNSTSTRDTAIGSSTKVFTCRLNIGDHEWLKAHLTQCVTQYAFATVYTSCSPWT